MGDFWSRFFNWWNFRFLLFVFIIFVDGSGEGDSRQINDERRGTVAVLLTLENTKMYLLCIFVWFTLKMGFVYLIIVAEIYKRTLTLARFERMDYFSN